jgi:hypothetical protein
MKFGFARAIAAIQRIGRCHFGGFDSVAGQIRLDGGKRVIQVAVK